MGANYDISIQIGKNCVYMRLIVIFILDKEYIYIYIEVDNICTDDTRVRTLTLL